MKSHPLGWLFVLRAWVVICSNWLAIYVRCRTELAIRLAYIFTRKERTRN